MYKTTALGAAQRKVNDTITYSYALSFQWMHSKHIAKARSQRAINIHFLGSVQLVQYEVQNCAMNKKSAFTLPQVYKV